MGENEETDGSAPENLQRISTKEYMSEQETFFLETVVTNKSAHSFRLNDYDWQRLVQIRENQ